MQKFIEHNRSYIDRCIESTCRTIEDLDDYEREMWVLMDDDLMEMARRQGFDINEGE